MDMNEARIKKIYELAMRGVGGEKESAQALLNKKPRTYIFMNTTANIKKLC